MMSHSILDCFIWDSGNITVLNFNGNLLRLGTLPLASAYTLVGTHVMCVHNDMYCLYIVRLPYDRRKDVN
jgi:hypothetical protein